MEIVQRLNCVFIATVSSSMSTCLNNAPSSNIILDWEREFWFIYVEAGMDFEGAFRKIYIYLGLGEREGCLLYKHKNVSFESLLKEPYTDTIRTVLFQSNPQPNVVKSNWA